jgi:hypothetical protein
MARRPPACALLLLLASQLACGAHRQPASPPASGSPPAQPAGPPAAATPASPRVGVPERLSDEEFWALSTSLSEPDGNFRSDNLLSNEVLMQFVIPDLIRTTKPGRVYMGVGPEQNFTYIAATKPAMVFIVDIRRGNLDLQLYYKALFELSNSRAEFVSRLFARRLPPLPADATVEQIFQAVYAAPMDEAYYAETKQAALDLLTKKRHLGLTETDLNGIDYVSRAFQMFGPGLSYWSTGVSRGGMRNAPTYWDLMLLKDETGRNWSYLATDENFRFMKQLEERNMLVPVVGDFGGNKALRAVGGYIKDHHDTVSAFYLSNVEQYLVQDGKFELFMCNVATLPLDETSSFIRSTRNGQFGYAGGFGSLSSELGNMLRESSRYCPATAKSPVQ